MTLTVNNERLQALKERIDIDVEAFFLHNTPEDSVLVLDSIGPAFTRHYLLLSAIGLDRLSRFKAVHAYSGGVFALFGFLGFTSGNAQLAYEDFLVAGTERKFREFHHPKSLGPMRVMYNLMRYKSAFLSTKPIIDSLEYIFKPEYLSRTLKSFPSNIRIHLGDKIKREIAVVKSDAIQDFGTASIKDLIALATKVPFVYGDRTHSDRYFDAAFSKSYRKDLHETLATGRATLVSTPWKSGERGSIRYVKCVEHTNAKHKMLGDFTRLLLNLPIRDWGQDIAMAFG